MDAPFIPEEREVEIHRDHDAEVDVESDDGEEGLPDTQQAVEMPLKFNFSWRKLWRFAGPGWLMSLAYLDPGNLESDLQQGAYTGYRLVWVLFWATVMGLVLQEMSARLGIVTGRDLAQTVRAGYPRWLNYVIYVNMEIAVIGSDIQEVVGTGIAIYLLSNKAVPVWAGCLITGAGARCVEVGRRWRRCGGVTALVGHGAAVGRHWGGGGVAGLFGWWEGVWVVGTCGGCGARQRRRNEG